jgi:hypothetical protein
MRRAIVIAFLAMLQVVGAVAQTTPIVVRGRIAVVRLAHDDRRVLKVELRADDGRVFVLDPAVNGREPAQLDGRRVEIVGRIKPGTGGGPFLTVDQLQPLS